MKLVSVNVGRPRTAGAAEGAMTGASPIACRMDALTPAERARRSEVVALLIRRATVVGMDLLGI